MWDRGSEKGPSTYFSSFQNISYSKRHLCPLQLLSYALEISMSIMVLQWPEYLGKKIIAPASKQDGKCNIVLGPF